MRSKIFTVLGVVVFIVCLSVLFWYMEEYKVIYYTQIDNTKLVKLSSDDSMRYEYTLYCYNKMGGRKKLIFKTSRILKEDAYILLEVRALGVHKWEEVKFADIPVEAQQKIRQ